MQEKSYWMDSAQEKEGDKLEENVKTQVCIIGAGIAGIATAYYLMKAGKKVVILDKREAVSSVTARTTAKITSEHDLFYDYLIQSYGEETAKAYLQANEEAKEDIANIIKENEIDCDFERQDAYVYTCDENELIKIKKEVEAVKKLGFPAEYVEETELPFKVKGAIKFPNLMEGVYVATGFKKWGMTTSHVAAKIITDEIMGKYMQLNHIVHI